MYIYKKEKKFEALHCNDKQRVDPNESGIISVGAEVTGQSFRIITPRRIPGVALPAKGVVCIIAVTIRMIIIGAGTISLAMLTLGTGMVREELVGSIPRCSISKSLILRVDPLTIGILRTTRLNHIEQK